MSEQAEENGFTAQDFTDWREDRRRKARAIVEGIPFGRRQRRIVSLLVERFGRWTSTEDIAAAVWDDPWAGEPATARHSLAVQVGIIRRRLAPHGLTIEWHAGGERRIVFTGEGSWT